VVKAPVDRVVAPSVVPSIAPPVIATPLEENYWQVTVPAILTASVAEPILMASGVVLSVPILIVCQL